MDRFLAVREHVGCILPRHRQVGSPVVVRSCDLSSWQNSASFAFHFQNQPAYLPTSISPLNSRKILLSLIDFFPPPQNSAGIFIAVVTF